MASGDAKAFPIKGAAYRITFPILDADGDLVPGATGLDSMVSKDGGTFAACTSEATQIATSSGMYYLDLTSTEMNADTVAIIVKASTSGAKTTPIVLYPVENTDIPVNVKAIGDTVQSATDLKDFADTGYDPSGHRTQAQTKGIDASAVDSIHDEIIESTLTFRQIIRVFLSALGGKSTGGGTTSLKFRDYADGKDRIAATVDGNNNRTVITLDGT